MSVEEGIFPEQLVESGKSNTVLEANKPSLLKTIGRNIKNDVLQVRKAVRDVSIASGSHNPFESRLEKAREHLKRTEAMKEPGPEGEEIISRARRSVNNAEEAFKSGKVAKKSFGQIGGELLENLGKGGEEVFGGNAKVFGAAKVGAYFVGASMLADFLNPFDDNNGGAKANR